jgi:hypothetical protein
MIEFPRWFPREYLALVTLFVWTATMAAMALVPEWIHNRRERRRALTAAPESRPKSSE